MEISFICCYGREMRMWHNGRLRPIGSDLNHDLQWAAAQITQPPEWPQSTPWATMACPTFMKPAMLAPAIRSPGLSYSWEAR